MGVVQLQPRCPPNVGGIAIDPQPDWSFDNLLSELDMIEKRIAASSSFPLPFAKRESREASSAACGERRAFVMRIDDMDDVEEDEDEAHEQALVVGKKFRHDDYDISENDDSEDELSETEDLLMEKEEVAEGALSELTREHVFSITEEIRNKVVALETDLLSDNKKLTSALAQAEKHTEARREMDRKLDMQYQRTIAEALDNHLTAVQRSHEHKSQIEERKIRDDAAIEEAKRRDKALQEEKLRQEKVRVETEARLAAERRRAEEAEAERKAAKEAAEKIARDNEARTAAAAEAAAKETITSKDPGTVGGVEAQQGGDVVKCAASALQSEETRLQVERKVAAENENLGLGSDSAYDSHRQKIFKIIKQTTGTKEGVRKRVDQLVQIFSSPSCPQSITISMFADSVVKVASSKSAPFAIAHLAVAVTSKVPLAMDVLLAKLNKACIFTIPKYISYSKTVFDTEAAHKKAIGYDDEEDETSYLERMELCMKFYGALVQTEIGGAQNMLGEGWLWLARFLNSIPANVYTATALQAFLETAGFALFRRYRSQFKKLLNIVDQHFLVALRQQGNDVKRTRLAAEIETYMTSNSYLKEPEGRSFVNQTDSSKACFDPERAEQPYHHQQTYRGQSSNYQSFGSYY